MVSRTNLCASYNSVDAVFKSRLFIFVLYTFFFQPWLFLITDGHFGFWSKEMPVMLWFHINVCHICHKGASVLIYVRTEWKKHVLWRVSVITWLRITFQLTSANAHALGFNENCIGTLNGMKDLPFQKGRNERRLHKIMPFCICNYPA